MKRAFISYALLACIVFAGAGLLAAPPSPPPPTKNVYEIMKSRKDLSEFADMIGDADLKSLFTATIDEPVTVFAPSNDALKDVSRDVMKRIKANLPSFVKYHVISGSLVSSGALHGRRSSPAAANGETLQFDGLDRKNPPKVNDAVLTVADIQATNGIIHIVSTALIPPSLEHEPAPPPEAPKPPPVAAQTPAAETTTGKPAATAATTTGKAAATTTAATKPAQVTTTGVATVSPAASTTSTSAPPAASDSSGGFSLFGHKFSW